MIKNEKRPEIQISVGSFFYAKNMPEEGVLFDPKKYGPIISSPIIKKVGIKESSENTPIKASGIDYMTVSQKDSEELSVEVIAFAPDDLADYRGDSISEKGLIKDDTTPNRPFFACGFPIEKTNGHVDLTWYPKCQLLENSGDVETKEDKFKEQNKTLTIKAYAFDEKSIKVHCDSELSSFPTGLTIDKFFSKVITDDEDLTSVLSTSENQEETVPEGA